MEDQPGLCGEKQFRAVFDAHYRLLHRFLTFRFGDAGRADDATQQAFVALWENCGKIAPPQARSFLFTTAIRKSLNELRREKVAVNFAILIDRGGPDRPDDMLEEKELNSRLEDAIRSLPHIQREVFLLNRMEKQTYAEIAGLLGISVKAVEKRMHKALLTLRHVIPAI